MAALVRINCLIILLRISFALNLINQQVPQFSDVNDDKTYDSKKTADQSIVLDLESNQKICQLE